jgi:hypothetical protein
VLLSLIVLSESRLGVIGPGVGVLGSLALSGSPFGVGEGKGVSSAETPEVIQNRVVTSESAPSQAGRVKHDQPVTDWYGQNAELR